MSRTRQRADGAERQLCWALDKINEFDKYERSILPLLRKAADEGWKPARMRRELGSYFTARVIQDARNGSTVAAIDTLNRYEGKPFRRKIKNDVHDKLTKEELMERFMKLLAEGDIFDRDDP